MMTKSFILFLSDFKGINDIELNEMLSVCKLIDSKIENSGAHLNFLDKNLRKELDIKKELNKNSSNITIANIHDNKINSSYMNNFNNFVKNKFKIYNDEIKLISRISKILEELEKSEFKEKFYNKIDNLIFKKQLEFLTIFYEKIFY
jgi:hypothetical protein